jgi:uncharacterized protein (DUF2062 family)
MYLDRHMQRCGQRVAARIKGILQSGITPQKLALTITLGTSVGLMPVLWGTSLVCMLLATVFRLNQAAMQAVNYLCYPLQIALFIPFCRLGESLFPWGPRVSVALLTDALHGHLGATVSLVGWASLRGLGAWLITAPPLVLLFYPFLKRLFLRREESKRQTPFV